MGLPARCRRGLTRKSARELRRELQQTPPEIDILCTITTSHVVRGNHPVALAGYRANLFRRLSDVVYRNRIHENIYRKRGELRARYCDAVVIEHYGYLPEAIAAKNLSLIH